MNPSNQQNIRKNPHSSQSDQFNRSINSVAEDRKDWRFRMAVKRKSLWLHALGEAEVNILSLYCIILHVWETSSMFDLFYVGHNMFLLVFGHSNDMKKVKTYPIYNLFNTLIAIKPWPKEFVFQPPSPSYIPIWLQVKYMPLVLQTPKVAEAVGSMFHSYNGMGSSFIENDSYKTVMRLLVGLDLSKPVPRGFHTTIDNDKGVYFQFSYENLSHVCKCCYHFVTPNVESERRSNALPSLTAVVPTDSLPSHFSKCEPSSKEPVKLKDCEIVESSPYYWKGWGPDKKKLSMNDAIFEEGISEPLGGVVSELEDYVQCPGEGNAFIHELKESLQRMAASIEVQSPGNGCKGVMSQLSSMTAINPGPFVQLDLPFNKAHPYEFCYSWSLGFP